MRLRGYALGFLLIGCRGSEPAEQAAAVASEPPAVAPGAPAATPAPASPAAVPVASAPGAEPVPTAAPSPAPPDAAPSAPVDGGIAELAGVVVDVPSGTQQSPGFVDRPIESKDPMTGRVTAAPAKIRAAITLTAPGRFVVELRHMAKAASLEQVSEGIERDRRGTHLSGRPEPDGWSLGYTIAGERGAGDVHLREWHFGELAVQCEYDDARSPDPAAADAVCRSARPK